MCHGALKQCARRCADNAGLSGQTGAGRRGRRPLHDLWNAEGVVRITYVWTDKQKRSNAVRHYKKIIAARRYHNSSLDKRKSLQKINKILWQMIDKEEHRCYNCSTSLWGLFFCALFLSVKKHKLPQGCVTACVKTYEGGRRTLNVLAGYKFRQEVPKWE